jgi:phosphate transport system substrate-binding protein
MNKIKLAVCGIFALALMQACNRKPAVVDADTWITGTAKFAADESFEPIVGQEVEVFKAIDTAANPIILYRPETDVLRLLLNDSVRVAILSRGLDSNEIKILTARNLAPDTRCFAIDAVAIIVNQASNDTLITVNELRKMLSGQTKSDKNIVFDNEKSSLVRYLKDLAGTNNFKPKSVFALKSNKEVIRYVSTHPNALGITGFSWLDDPDADYADAVSKTKIVAVRDEDNKQYPTQYFKPSQTSLALKQYPLSRGLYIVNCTDRQGLGTGFAAFITSERGQRIILRSGLLPDSIPPREIVIKKSLN